MPELDERQDISKFVEAVGAVEPPANDESYMTFRHIFKRHNYFVLEGRFLIVKVSRSDRPFWGVGKKFIDLLNGLNDYYLVLLVSSSEGWVFSKAEVMVNIRNLEGKLRGTDNNYKINPPLPNRNAFANPKTFRKMIGINES